MKIHSEASARQFEQIAADSLAAIKEARKAVEIASKSKSTPDLSAIGKRSPTPKPAPADQADQGPPTSVVDPTGGLRGVVDRWKSRGKDVQVALDSVPPGESYLPHGAPIFDLTQEGNRDCDAITGPAIAAAHVARKELIEKELERRKPEQQRIEGVKQKMAADADAYWRR